MKVRVACITGDKETLQELIDADHGIVNTPYEYGKTPLCIAAGWGHNEIVKLASELCFLRLLICLIGT